MKEKIYKLLFALEIALIFMVISAIVMMPTWCISLFVGLIVVTKLFMVILKNPASNYQLYLDAIGNVIVVVAMFIIFACYDYVNLVLAILVSVFIIIEEMLKVVFYYKPNNQLIDALNFSCEMFVFLALTAMMIAPYNTTMLAVATIALLINTVALALIQGYRYVYYYIFKKNKRNVYSKKRK